MEIAPGIRHCGMRFLAYCCLPCMLSMILQVLLTQAQVLLLLVKVLLAEGSCHCPRRCHSSRGMVAFLG